MYLAVGYLLLESLAVSECERTRFKSRAQKECLQQKLLVTKNSPRALFLSD